MSYEAIIALMLLFLSAILILPLIESGSGEVCVLPEQLVKAMDDPRNEKFWDDFLSKRKSYDGKIVIEADGLCRWEE